MKQKIQFASCVLFCMLLVGCSTSTNHSTHALLFQKMENTDSKQVKYHLARSESGELYSSNPIFIAADGRFSISIDKIHPGWIHQRPPASGSSSEGSTDRNEEALPSTQVQHLSGKELWMLSKITYLDTQDPLEAKSKTYYSSSNIKYDSLSYALMPLDAGEKLLFTHDSDGAYRINIEVYEVDSVAFKKELYKLTKNPGLTELVVGIFNTGKQILGAVAGGAVDDYLNEKLREPLALERLLLTAGAVVEFQGEVTIQRAQRFDAKYAGFKYFKREFRLYDVFKSCGGFTFPSSEADYAKNLKSMGEVEITEDDVTGEAGITACKSMSKSGLGYIQLSVGEAPSPALAKDEESKVQTVPGIKRAMKLLRESIASENKAYFSSLNGTDGVAVWIANTAEAQSDMQGDTLDQHLYNCKFLSQKTESNKEAERVALCELLDITKHASSVVSKMDDIEKLNLGNSSALSSIKLDALVDAEDLKKELNTLRRWADQRLDSLFKTNPVTERGSQPKKLDDLRPTRLHIVSLEQQLQGYNALLVHLQLPLD